MIENSTKLEYFFEHDFWSGRIPQWQKHFKHLAGRQDLRFLEVGSLEGRSATWMLDNLLTDKSSTLTCVDQWGVKDYERTFDRNIVASGRSNQVIKVKGGSQIMLRKLNPRSFDLIYVDGSHIAKDALLDAAQCWILLKVGGYMVFDDYLWEPQDAPVSRTEIAVNAFLQCFAPNIRVLQLGGKGNQVFIEKIVEHIPRPELVRWGV